MKNSENQQIEPVGIYTVNGDSDALDEWTCEELAAALIEPLGALGITVECESNEYGLSLNTVPDDLRDDVKNTIARVIVEG